MGAGKSCGVCKLVGVLVAIGAINWGLVGLFNYNLVESFLGVGTGLTKAVYALVGVAGVLAVLAIFKCCPCQKKGA